MIATKSWGNCECNCGQKIKAGVVFEIHGGAFYIGGHFEKPQKRQPLVRPNMCSKTKSPETP